MPNYTYQCENCSHHFDIHQDFSEDSLTTCPECGQETLLKVYKPARIMFKGSGFYVNDNKSSRNNYLNGVKEDKNGNGKEVTEKKETSSETPKAETTPKKEASVDNGAVSK